MNRLAMLPLLHKKGVAAFNADNPFWLIRLCLNTKSSHINFFKRLFR